MPEVTSPSSRSKRSTRSKARKRAVDILFEAELRGDDPLETLAVRTSDANPPVRDFTDVLVRGVCMHRVDLDELISKHLAGGWTLARLPRVDRAVLRLATFEILRTEVPVEVAVAEAVSLVEELSTDDSATYVNGVLGTIAAASDRD